MKKTAIAYILFSLMPLTNSAYALQKALSEQDVRAIVDINIQELMEKESIPGMAVGIIYHGKTHTYSYGMADTKAQIPVTNNTIFELGSVSKTFTGLAAGYALAQGIVNLDDTVQKYWPALPEKPWGNIRMLHLATYTAGGLPLQLPDSVTDERSLTTYYQTWQPVAAPGTVRAYSNASIGLFGKLAVQKSGQTFEQYLTHNIFIPLSLNHTYIHLPDSVKKNYAWGYRKEQPVRVTPGMLDAEAYGVKSTVKDMVSYLMANMHPETLAGEPVLTQAIEKAQSRYFLTDGMYQGLGWEMYNWPTEPQKIIDGSSNAVALKPHDTMPVSPAQPASPASWVHKTGSTNGFGAYIAFIPDENVGIVMLANKSYPNPVRVETAYRIISALLQQK